MYKPHIQIQFRAVKFELTPSSEYGFIILVPSGINTACTELILPNFIPGLAQFSMLLKKCCFFSLSGKKSFKKTTESN